MKKIISTLLTTLALTACQTSTSAISGKSFALLPEKTITITFDGKENRFFGKALNNYFGTYRIENNNITLNLMGSTMMAGPVEEMKKETTYFQNLSKVKTYSLQNKTLELTGDDVKLQYEETQN